MEFHDITFLSGIVEITCTEKHFILQMSISFFTLRPVFIVYAWSCFPVLMSHRRRAYCSAKCELIRSNIRGKQMRKHVGSIMMEVTASKGANDRRGQDQDHMFILRLFKIILRTRRN
jgi:hypothetical protein